MKLIGDLSDVYGKVFACLGMRRERTKQPKHDPDDEKALVLWRPEEIEDQESSDDDNSDDDRSKSTSTSNSPRKKHKNRKDKAENDESESDDDDEEEEETKKEPIIRIAVRGKTELAKKAAKKRKNKGKKVKVPIVVDPRLALKLRPHQVVGVEFVYRCMMETKYAANNEYGEGCILG